MKYRIIEELEELENKIIHNTEICNSVNLGNVKNILERIAKSSGLNISRVFVVGRIANRCILLEIGSNIFFVISVNKKIQSLLNKYWFFKETLPDYKTKCAVMVKIREADIKKFYSPLIRLVVLYHKENFPYPRFALGVSDICGAIRDTAVGDVRLTDMQADLSIEDIINQISNEKPDILGLSVTFGQQDILDNILKLVIEIPEYNPEIVVGGSLAFLNRHQLLEMYPNLIICQGYGENTFIEIIKYWYGLIKKDEIPGITFINQNNEEVNVKQKDNWEEYGYPELDLLPTMLEKKGVMSLECSRGCMNACTFCPRYSKGRWHDICIENIAEIMKYIYETFKKYPNVSRKIFLVDEEFFGDWADEKLDARIKQLIDIFKKYDFKFETSARIKQVYNITKDKYWHIKRFKIMKQLRDAGLTKILFGIESGIDSVLIRFNKNTMSTENTNGIRVLTSLGIPFRATYITFDPLMSMNELVDTYHYQGRTDIILTETNRKVEDLFELISNEEYIKNNSQGIPLFAKIPYMLVSLECLSNSKYLELARKENLLQDFNMAMGKYNCNYVDWRIGLMSYYSQLWIDKNFAMDYFFKSLMKIKPLSISEKLEKFRFEFKKSAYDLLGLFLKFTLRNENIVVKTDAEVNLIGISSNITLDVAFEMILKLQFESLKTHIEESIQDVMNLLEADERYRLENLYDDWISRDWRLINS